MSHIINENRVVSVKNILQMYSDFILVHGLIKNNDIASKLDLYIREHINEDIDVDSLCKYFNYKKTTFYKVTNSIYGMSILQHITILKIQHAKHLLSSTNLPIYEIAFQVGIDDYNYFTKKFKKIVQCTPSEFRKNSFLSIKLNNN